MRLEQERFSNKHGLIKCTFHAHFLGKLLKNDALQQMKEVEEKDSCGIQEIRYKTQMERILTIIVKRRDLCS